MTGIMFVRADNPLNPLNPLNPQSNSFLSFLSFLCRHIKLFAMLHYTHTSPVLNMTMIYPPTPPPSCFLLPASYLVRPAAPWPIVAGDDDICMLTHFSRINLGPPCN